MTVQVDLSQLMDEAKAKKRYVSSAPSNYASLLGDPCLRYLVYMRTHGHERSLYEVGLQYIFDEGKTHERALLKEIQDELGFDIRAQQKGWPLNPEHISGRIDGEINLGNNLWVPLEIKSISHYAFLKLPDKDHLMELVNSKKRWERHYPAQIQLYLYFTNSEEGMMVFKDKLTGRIKQFNVTLDYEYTDSLLDKAKLIEDHIKKQTLPDRTEENSLHEGCDFYHICLPETIHEGTMVDDPDLEAKLDRRGELKPIVSEYEELDKEIKEGVKNKPETVCGNWILKGKFIEKNMKASEAKTLKYWETKISKIKE